MMNDDLELAKKLIDDDEEHQHGNLKTRHLGIKNHDGFARGTTSKNEQQRRGIPCCCKCVLLTTIVFFILMVGAFTCTYLWIKDVVEHLTVQTPHDGPYPIVHMPAVELDLVKDRVIMFVDELRAGHDVDHSLEITQDEINGFIGQSHYLRGNMMVTLKAGSIMEEYSLPTYMLPGGKGRYYVGSDIMTIDADAKVLEMKVETEAKHSDWFDGPLFFAQLKYLITKDDDDETMLELYLKKGSFFGQVAPEDYINEHENILETFYSDPDHEEAVKVVEGIERVVIEDGKIVITPRRNSLN